LVIINGADYIEMTERELRKLRASLSSIKKEANREDRMIYTSAS
jgi:hypothetical protein